MSLGDDDTILTPAQAAQMLGVTTGTLVRWSRDGLLTAARTSSGQRRYTYAAIRACLEARRPEVEAKRRLAAITIRLREQGCTILETAEMLQMSYSAIQRLAKWHNTQGGQPEPVSDAVVAYLLQGYTLKKAEQLAQWETNPPPQIQDP
jgi:excisionase family DNA binding protein